MKYHTHQIISIILLHSKLLKLLALECFAVIQASLIMYFWFEIIYNVHYYLRIIEEDCLKLRRYVHFGGDNKRKFNGRTLYFLTCFICNFPFFFFYFFVVLFFRKTFSSWKIQIFGNFLFLIVFFFFLRL